MSSNASKITFLPSLAEDSGQIRTHAESQIKKNGNGFVSAHDTRLEEAETRTDQANTRTRQADTRTDQANTRTDQANTRTDEANTRTEQSEARERLAEFEKMYGLPATDAYRFGAGKLVDAIMASV